jgi:hypothetical protein
MATVERDISRMTSASTRCRPIRSPSGPKTNPPRGRMKNAAAKIAKAFSSAAVSFPDGKKLAAMKVARKP